MYLRMKSQTVDRAEDASNFEDFRNDVLIFINCYG